MTSGKLERILILNRGEIVDRIAKTLVDMNRKPIGVSLEGVFVEPYLKLCHEVFSMPKEGAFLDLNWIEHLIEISQPDAVHPGYGFLSEDARLAETCQRLGVVFIGPTPKQLRRFADKVEGKGVAKDLGIPTLESVDQGSLPLEAFAKKVQKTLKMPILVKPAAGGGGKGMIVVRSKDTLKEGLSGAAQAAEKHFGDGRLFAESFVYPAYHVEVQTLADQQGHVFSLGTRDCSVQRRHQKILEEAPSARLNEKDRKALESDAVRLLEGQGYQGAATVEFLVGEGGDHFFLEVNARIQVEHPVTEMVTGFDIVKAQVGIAEGHALGALDISPVQQTCGHAIEARVYAENPRNDFLPASGWICDARWPSPTQDLRIEPSVAFQSRVSPEFDPMLMKVSAQGIDRPSAIKKLKEALASIDITGCDTNINHLIWLLNSQAFADQMIHVKWVEEHQASFVDDVYGVFLSDDENDRWDVRVDGTSGGNWDGNLQGTNDMHVLRRYSDGKTWLKDAATGYRYWVDARPKLSEEESSGSIESPMTGKVVDIVIQQGDSVEKDQTLLKLEAMKMVYDVKATLSGRVDLKTQAGQNVQQGDLLAKIGAI